MFQKITFSIISIFLALLVFHSFFTPLSQDEGVFLTIANGILNGKAPYIHFFDHKPPGIYFLFAPIIDLFGKNIWALKSFLVLNNAVAAFLVYKIANRLKRGSGILASFLFLFTAIFFQANYLIAEPFMATLLLGAVYFFCLGSDPKGSDPSIFLSGLMIGFSILLKQVAIINFLILGFFIYRENKESIQKFLAGTAVPIIPVIIYLASNNAIKDALNQIVTLNFTSYPRESLLNVIKNISGTFRQTLPVWVLFGFGIFGLDSFSNENEEKDPSTPLGMTRKLLLAFIFFPIPILFFRHYPHYWLQIIPFISVFAGIALYDVILRLQSKNPVNVKAGFLSPLGNTPLRSKLRSSIRGTASLWYCKANALLAIQPRSKLRGSPPFMTKKNIFTVSILLLTFFSFLLNYRWFSWMASNQNRPKLKEQTKVAEYIDSLPQKNILAENQFVGYYFITNKEPLTKYLYLSEVNELENAEEKTIEVLKNNPETIIVWPKDTNFAYAKKLQAHILTNYEPVKEYNALELVIYKSK